MPKSRLSVRGLLLGVLFGATVLMGSGSAGADPIPLEAPAAVPEADVVVGGSCGPTSESVLPCLINSLSARTAVP
ncbi:hypothetical protein [Nocardia amamiensis]|uniref:hypothetical protein n=1 Tax=Nocardia amamiensis TaxID=404578 RepID=UPI0012F4CE05|nr:hypothetical protein [Nocardia amamiensis]